MTTIQPHGRRSRTARRAGVLAGLLLSAAGALLVAAPAQAATCSPSSSQASCTVNTSTTVTGGALGVEAPASLYWNFAQSGYDQVESGSSAALGSCTPTGAATTCTGGVAPVLQVVDATGAGNGWALSAYLSGSTLPTGTKLSFNGAGTTIGASAAGPSASIAGTAPSTTCDFGSSCTAPTAATTTCSHAPLGFSTCPTYAGELTTTSSAAQVDLYSAAASTGVGAVCFGSGTASAASCVGTASKAYFNMTLPGKAPTGTYTGAVINLTATSGP